MCSAAWAPHRSATLRSEAQALVNRDCRGVLLAPPFYFKGVTEDGLYKWFSQVFAATGDRLHDVFLYNIPSVTQVPLPVSLIKRLKADFPKSGCRRERLRRLGLHRGSP